MGIYLYVGWGGKIFLTGATFFSLLRLTEKTILTAMMSRLLFLLASILVFPASGFGNPVDSTRFSIFAGPVHVSLIDPFFSRVGSWATTSGSKFSTGIKLGLQLNSKGRAKLVSGAGMYSRYLVFRDVNIHASDRGGRLEDVAGDLHLVYAGIELFRDFNTWQNGKIRTGVAVEVALMQKLDGTASSELSHPIPHHTFKQYDFDNYYVPSPMQVMIFAGIRHTFPMRLPVTVSLQADFSLTSLMYSLHHQSQAILISVPVGKS